MGKIRKNRIRGIVRRGKGMQFLTLFQIATDKGITKVAGIARADGIVVYDLATCIESTCTRARIDTLGVNTSQGLTAIRANHALGSAVRGGSDETTLARANGIVTRNNAFAVRATRRGPARIDWIPLKTSLKRYFNNVFYVFAIKNLLLLLISGRHPWRGSPT